MFNGNYKKIDSILTAVKKYPFTEDLTKREAAHALVDLLSLVGAILPLERKYENIEINIHKGVLPTDIVYIHGVNNKGNSCANPGIPMKYATDIYHSALHTDEAKKICAGSTINNDQQVAQLYPPTLADGANSVNGLLWGETIPAPSYTSRNLPKGVFENSYNINSMSIDTSFPYGWVEIAYDAIKCDSDGFPMIPDDASFRQAYKYYLLKNAAEPSYYRNDVSKAVYNDIDTQYSFYIGQAQNSFNMPSPDQMEALSAGLMRILPSQTEYKDGWRGFNKPE